MTMCFQSRAATVGFQRFIPGPAAGIPGVGKGRLASPTRGTVVGGNDATGGGIIGACVQPTTISPPSTMDVRIRLNLDLITRRASRGRTIRKSLTVLHLLCEFEAAGEVDFTGDGKTCQRRDFGA